LNLLGLIGKGKEGDRRPTEDKLERLLKYLDCNNRLTMSVGGMVQFVIATAMWQDEICSITWKDVDARRRIVIVRDRTRTFDPKIWSIVTLRDRAHWPVSSSAFRQASIG
jgi:integrase